MCQGKALDHPPLQHLGAAQIIGDVWVGLVGWLVGWLVGRSVGRSVGWLVGWVCVVVCLSLLKMLKVCFLLGFFGGVLK